ncbi:hypothetical protein SESBI_33588 [Sesbania bispinosa]|nr:hypothetical protein SESBI_33588 [Sesbania bispinosa]
MAKHDLPVEVPADETHGEDIAGAVGEPDKLEDSRTSETTAEYNDVFGNVSAADIFKYGGMYLVGAFVFQTIYSVWALRNYVSNQKDVDLEINGREKRNVLFNGNGKTVPVAGSAEDQIGMAKKIEEIKLMAREARKIELEKKGEDDESDVSSRKLGIEKEIGARLLKLQNRINSNNDSSAALRVNAHGNSAAGVARDGNKNVNKGNEALLFKKKFKFKSPSTKATKTPKGFPGTQDRRASNGKKRDLAGMLNEDKQVSQQDVVTQKSVSSVPSEERGNFVDDKSRAILNHGKNLEEKMETPNRTEVEVDNKSIDSGGFQKTSVGMSSLEVNQDSGPIFEKDNVHSINGSSRHGLPKTNSAANRVKVKQANTRTDMWWLNLRYVLVILMQRGSNGERAKGLYSVKFTSKDQEQSDDSYTVAFEDHADANNFCFILESFFKDLGDFSADAVPMSIQELNEEIISHAMKVVFVKKRQLQLYAGQPLVGENSADHFINVKKLELMEPTAEQSVEECLLLTEPWWQGLLELGMYGGVVGYVGKFIPGCISSLA